MLSELFIRNFAIIDELRIPWNAGFNVLTGETGAGKSIILDAVSLIMGGRADKSMVRAGCDKAYIEATFILSKQMQATIASILTDESLDDESPEQLLIARELRTNGRTVCRVNGRSVSLNLLREISAPLIDIHGQGEHLSLLQPKAHLPLLDAFARLKKEQAAVGQVVKQLTAVRNELQALERDERLLAQRVDMLQFQIQEIGSANLKEGEEDELRAERTRLANAEQLTNFTTEAIVRLNGIDEDDESEAVVDMLGQAERALDQLVRLDDTQNGLLQNLQGLAFQLQEIAAELQDYQAKIEFNPKRLNYVEERLEILGGLKRKYGDDVAEILAVRETAVVELTQIGNSKARKKKLLAEEDKCLREIGKLADALSKKRQKIGKKLAIEVEKQLKDLYMEGARFEVQFRREESANGAYVGKQRLAFDQSGIDQAEFIMSANPGEPLKPMVKVASGGETARLMLALKTALAQVDGTPTLIFDEIDQGIGGRVGDVVGRKLWGLTAVSQHQVIVVTHLPQLAGYGDVHFRVGKRVHEGRTTTAVRDLDGDGRIQELGDMLGTQGKHARGGAVSILRQAHATKQSLGTV